MLQQMEAQDLLKEGIRVAKQGDLTLARSHLEKVTELNPQSTLAWIWLAGVTEAPDQVMTYLKRALEIDPTNIHAQNGIKWAEEQLRDSIVTWKCPICRKGLPEKVDQCSACGAFLTLDDPSKLLNNDDVDEEKVFRAIRHYEGSGLLSYWDSFNQHFNLGLAYLNVKQIAKGINHLRSALHLQPDNEVLSAQLVRLFEQPEVIAAQTWEADPPKQDTLGTILIVDDSPTVRKLVTITLDRQNYQVISASDGFEALAKLGKTTPDLILLDITMPRMDGYQVCKVVRENQTTRNIPVVMLSSKDGFFDKVRGRMAGSTDHIAKPFQPDVLVKTIEKHLQQS